MRFHAILTSLVGLLFFTPCSFAQEEHPIAAIVKSKLKDLNTPFTLRLIAKTKPGMASKLEAAFAPVLKQTRAEKGCSSYILTQNAEDRSVYIVLEEWANFDALKSHLAQPYTNKLLGEISFYLEAQPEISVFTPIPATTAEAELDREISENSRILGLLLLEGNLTFPRALEAFDKRITEIPAEILKSGDEAAIKAAKERAELRHIAFIKQLHNAAQEMVHVHEDGQVVIDTWKMESSRILLKIRRDLKNNANLTETIKAVTADVRSMDPDCRASFVADFNRRGKLSNTPYRAFLKSNEIHFESYPIEQTPPPAK